MKHSTISFIITAIFQTCSCYYNNIKTSYYISTI